MRDPDRPRLGEWVMTEQTHHDGDYVTEASLSHILFFRHSPVKRHGVCYGQSQQETQHTAEEVAEHFIIDYMDWQNTQASRGITRALTSTVVWSSPAPRCMTAELCPDPCSLCREL